MFLLITQVKNVIRISTKIHIYYFYLNIKLIISNLLRNEGAQKIADFFKIFTIYSL